MLAPTGTAVVMKYYSKPDMPNTINTSEQKQNRRCNKQVKDMQK